MKPVGYVALSLGLWAALCVPRLWRERALLSDAREAVLRRADPRDGALVRSALEARERDAFRSRLRDGSRPFTWPGLRNVQVDWAWLEVLQGMHSSASYEGDFSWLFAKLDFIARAAPGEARMIAQLAPYFFVIGKDKPGACVVMQHVIEREPAVFNTWFWSGYHAMENLHMPRLAGDLYARAAALPGAPDYVAALSARLSYGDAWLDRKQRREILEKELSPALLERLRYARPEYFQ